VVLAAFLAAGAFTLAIALLVAGAATRALRAARATRLAALEARWRESLQQAATDPGDAGLPEIRRRELPDFIALWSRFHEQLRGEPADRLAALLTRHGIEDRLLRMLHRRSPRMRLIAIAALGRLRAPRAWARLEKLAHDRSAITSFAAARALLRIDPRRGLDALTSSIPERRDWPLARLGTIFEELGAPTVTPALLTMLLRRPRPGLDRVVRLARFGQRERISTLVRGWLGSNTDPEVLVAGLDYIDDRSDLPWAHGAIANEEWRVRMAAARALGRVGGRDELAPLLEVLRDPVWWVRYHAAQALTRLQGLEPFELETLREGARDAFAADMLGQALAERRWS
jgi:HEAT repeat protein